MIYLNRLSMSTVRASFWNYEAVPLLRGIWMVLI